MEKTSQFKNSRDSLYLPAIAFAMLKKTISLVSLSAHLQIPTERATAIITMLQQEAVIAPNLNDPTQYVIEDEFVQNMDELRAVNSDLTTD